MWTSVNSGVSWIEETFGNINFENYNILSNNIHDIEFDKYGYVYLATELGISILETSFSEDVHNANISVSPNPFKINEHNELTITNVTKDSNLKIMNLSGHVIKDFHIGKNQKSLVLLIQPYKALQICFEVRDKL